MKQETSNRHQGAMEQKVWHEENIREDDEKAP